MKKILMLGLFIALPLLGLCAVEQTITLSSLLDEMVNRDDLTRFSSVEYKTLAATSYDRRSERDLMMLANWDRSYFIREEENSGRSEYVLLESAKAGAITRFWITYHGPGGRTFYNGTLRIYLDGSETPAIEGPISDLISLQKLAPYPLSMSVSPDSIYEQRGHNLYLPIPWATSCKVTYESPEISTEGAVPEGENDGGEALYYQINYREYEKGTAVESFSMEGLAVVESQVEAVCKELLAPLSAGDVDGDDANFEMLVESDISLRAGKELVLDFSGERAIDYLSLQFNPADFKGKLKAKRFAQMLRSLALQIEFDGERMVYVPVGNFFGVGNRLDETQTYFNDVSKEGLFQTAWVMPFKESCKVKLINYGKTAISIPTLKIGSKDFDFTENTMYFHADWNYQGILDSNTANRPIDMDGSHASVFNYITVEGKGRYVGDSMTLFNGGNGWWGEGDDLVYVDGETFPSQFGTGTEDYFGYAWCREEIFNTPFIAQPSGEGNLRRGYTVNSRYRILDDITFNNHLRFDFEFWHWHKCDLEMGAVIFWYGMPGAKSAFQTNETDFKQPVILDTFALKRAAR